ncbi:AAA family ATPase [Allohahella sp. A8]|uniref:AAA family ATPase n=1 Tax=Allohahella sp. A8 TaxID=3141461 RepID=UPI003A80235B
MIRDKIVLENIKGISRLCVEFEFSESNFLVITGKNGSGKTSLVKAYHLLKDPQIFSKSSGLNAIRADSRVIFDLDGFPPFEFFFNKKVGALDSRNVLPTQNQIVAELPVPFGERFSQFSLIAKHDSEIRMNIAASQYRRATELIQFLADVYSAGKFDDLKVTRVNRTDFYFLLRENDFYTREDHFSSGEYFLIQLFRLITSGAKLILIDEVDVALDAAAQVKLYAAVKPLLRRFGARLSVISHSLAFMSTVEEGGLYYLEEIDGGIVLQMRSFGYIKSDLYGFSGYERYVLTEDEVLEGFLEYLIVRYSIQSYYRFVTIGVGGVNQLIMIVEKNDRSPVFSESANVLCVVDKDSKEIFARDYCGPTQVSFSPVSDIERYIFTKRAGLFPDIPLPLYRESTNEKKASKSYWRYLTVDHAIGKNEIYKALVDSEPSLSLELADSLRHFLSPMST